MKNRKIDTKVTLVPLTEDDREQFILDNQCAFKYGAMMEFGDIHFYVNKCGFQIDQFWCEYFQPEYDMPNDEEHNPDEGPDEMFRFIKVMK